MALPKKKKFDVNIDPPKVGFEYLKYGFDRIQKLMDDTDEKSVYLPRTISFEDIDTGLFNYVEKDKLEFISNGKIVPAFFVGNERWGEFSKTWKFMDKDKNVPTPYITVRRVSKEQGTRMGSKFRVPQGRTFKYLDVPILDEGQLISLRFKIPQPTNVDLTYEIRLFTKFRVQVNQYDEMVFKNFSSLQDYIFIKGNPFPLILENTEEANTIENVDGDRFYVSIYTIKAKAFIQDEKEFEITKTSRLPRIGIGLQ